MKKIAFYTLGCKVNIYDSESVWELFKENGYERVSFNEIADIYIINTCTVTNQSDAKSRKIIRQAIRKNDSAVVVVMGCYAQLSPEEVSKIDGVDIISGTKNRKEIYHLVEEILEERKQLNVVTNLTDKFDDMSVTSFENTRAFLKIQDGCNNYCSYCIIPFARGSVVSKSKERVLLEAQELIDNGYKEIVLSGIHTGKYGVDIDYSLTSLVRDLSALPRLRRLRISSIEINEITNELLSLVKENSTIAKHLHIPLQSGSKKILNDMNRKYDTDYYKKRVSEIRSFIPDISITTDVIVGYPTETDGLFKETLQFVKETKFSELHVFPFSKRNGTKAARLKDLSKKVKHERVRKLIETNDLLAKEYADKFLEKTLDLIVETVNCSSIGYTSNYLKVEIDEALSKNEYYKIKIIKTGYPINKAVLI
ncbi:tRNA (N(6)-L-threonylcarbamoyladenosine(37)-C(2))-methylthiotransferase MtaB [Mycoplasmatota bacterium zrk1]